MKNTRGERVKRFQALHIVLLFIIILNILDFFEVLNPFWDYVKKIVSWFLVGLLFYRLSPTRVFVGVQKRWLDLWFVVSAFALTINDMLAYAHVARDNMLLNLTTYVGFFREAGTAVASVNVTEAMWNGLNFGIAPSVLEYGVQHVGNLTLTNPEVYVAFTHLGEQATYVLAPIGMSGSLLTLYNSAVAVAPAVSAWGLLLGMLGLIAWSFFVARIPVKSPSVMGIVESGAVHPSRFVGHFSLIFLSSVFFFLFIFSLVMEWLAIAIDAPILMIALLASVIVTLTFHRHFSLLTWEEWVTHVGAEYVEPFMQLFTRKRTILLGVSGLLVLHLLTEVFNYLLPFILPMRDQLYLTQLGPGHDNLFTLLNYSWSFTDVAMIFVAFANVLAWFGLFVIPGYIWYKIYRLRSEDHVKHLPRFSPAVLGLFAGSLVTMLLTRMIWFKGLDAQGLVGVDFYTQASANPAALLWGIAVFVLVYFSAQFGMRRFMYLIPIGSSIIFMGVYAVLFFFSTFKSYLLAGLNAFVGNSYVLGAIFFLFMLYSAVFYASGYLLFLYEIIRD